MDEKTIDKVRDTIIENVNSLAYEIAAMNESLIIIYNICNDADEHNWRDCMEKIQYETSKFI